MDLTQFKQKILPTKAQSGKEENRMVTRKKAESLSENFSNVKIIGIKNKARKRKE